jgi:hypothetical protein
VVGFDVSLSIFSGMGKREEEGELSLKFMILKKTCMLILFV